VHWLALHGSSGCCWEKVGSNYTERREMSDDDIIVAMEERKRALAEARAKGQGRFQAQSQARVWIKDDEEVWKTVRQVGEEEDTLRVSDRGEEFEVPRVDTHPFDPSHALDFDDASKMNAMHEAPLLDLLRRRYARDKIYTNVADVLISVNPYKNIPLLYEIPLLQMQDESEEEYEESDGELEEGDKGRSARLRPPSAALKKQLEKPHLHSVADKAFRFMTAPEVEISHGKVRRMNQSVVITGESGAGKTEASKYVMRYLIAAAQSFAAPNGGSKRDAMGKRIEEVLLQSNTVLEAFGNSKTLRNDNSSRFGKYIKLQYDADLRLVGAKTEHFLLEKSRLVRVDRDERSYHIFYQLCAGLSGEERAGLHLSGSAKDYHGIAQGGCLEIGDDTDEAQEFRSTRNALITLGFSPDECSAMWRLLSAILHMSNVRFQNSATANEGPEIVTGGLIEKKELAGLLGLEWDSFHTRIVKRTLISARGSMSDIPLNCSQAADNLGALVKTLYGLLFDWIVFKINQCHMEYIVTAGDGEQDMRSFIGILDIFGFEIMPINSFEQLCINYANEVLQKQFNHHIFVLEQEEYIKEGLDVTSILFRDNQPIIDLISMKPAGLMPLLEDQVLTGRKAYGEEALTDKKLLNLYHQEHHRNRPHPNYEKPRIECDQFILHHFAGTVSYDVQGFLEKNNDSLQYDLKVLMGQSTDPFVASLALRAEGALERAAQEDQNSTAARPRRGSDAKMANTVTVSKVFRTQLENLTQQLATTEPHYIKCIKPNGCKAPGGWNSKMVIEQLRYSGVLEVVRIRREAFPVRITFHEFYKQFRQLIGSPLPPNSGNEEAEREACKAICAKALDENDYQIGYRKVYLRDDALEKLRWALHQMFVDAAIQIQKMCRARLARKLAYTMRLTRDEHRRHCAAVVIQRAIRAWLRRKRREAARRRREAATLLQRSVRGWLARRKYIAAVAAAVSIQCAARSRTARRRAEEERARRRAMLEALSATKLQAQARMRLARKAFLHQRDAALRIQTQWRRYRAQRAFVAAVASAVRLQAWARCIIARTALQRALDAAVRLQTAYRAHLARKIAAERRRAREQAACEREAAIHIQRAARGFLARRKFKDVLHAVILIQSAARAAAARSKLCTLRTQDRLRREREARKATKLQAWARMCAARKEFNETRAATKLQAWTRMRADRKNFLRDRAAATLIQAAWRGHSAQQRYAQLRLAAICVQAATRMFLAKRAYQRMSGAALTLQCMYRCAAARKVACERLRARQAACTIQTAWRRYWHETQYARARTSAVKLSAWVRKVQASKRFGAAKRAASKIESLWRGLQVQREYRHKLVCVVRIQALIRRFLARCRYLRALAAISRIQVAARAYVRNRHLMEAVIAIFECASDGDANGVTAAIHDWPDLLFVRNRWDRSYSTLLHAACSSGRLDLVVLLEPFPEDVFAADIFGSTCVHKAASTFSYDLMKYLAKRANIDVEAALARDDDRISQQVSISRRKLSTNVNVFKLARLDRARAKRNIGGVRAGQLDQGEEDPDAKHLMAGYLKKRRETDRWNKRWCVLTETCLHYYHKKTDAAPSKTIRLQTAMLKKSLNVEYAFEIHAPELLDARNKEGRLYFQADNEQSLQSWMVPLHMVVGFYQFRNDKRTRPMEYLDINGRRELVQLANHKGETALHLAAQAHNERSTGRRTPAAAMHVISWLIENGADPNQLDGKGRTPLFAAVDSGSLDVAGLMVRCGGDPQIVDDEGISPLDLAGPEEEVEKLTIKHFHPTERSPMLPTPEKLFGFTYLAFLLEKFTVKDAESLTSPFVTVSVYNSKGKLTEAPQDIIHPAMRRPDYLWFGLCWQMQTPLETLDERSVVVFELRDQGEAKKAKTLAWGIFHLDLDRVNTESETITMYQPPVDPKLRNMTAAPDFMLQGEAHLTKGIDVDLTAHGREARRVSI
jgi:myosin-5